MRTIADREPHGEILLVGSDGFDADAGEDAEEAFASLELWMRSRYPSAREVLYRWSGSVLHTRDGLGPIDRAPGEDHVYFSAGGGHGGLTHGTIAALVITDLIHGAEVRWARLYSSRPVVSWQAEHGARDEMPPRPPRSHASERAGDRDRR